MIVKNKDLGERNNAEKNAIRIIKECVKDDKGFIIYTNGNQDLLSCCNKDLPAIVGSLFFNLMDMNYDDPNTGFSKDDLIGLVNHVDKILNKERNRISAKSAGMTSVDEYILKVLDDLKKKIENLKKKENGE